MVKLGVADVNARISQATPYDPVEARIGTREHGRGTCLEGGVGSPLMMVVFIRSGRGSHRAVHV